MAPRFSAAETAFGIPVSVIAESERAGRELPSGTFVERGTAAYRRTSLALFLAGFSTFSLLYAVQPLLPNSPRNSGSAPRRRPWRCH